MGSPSWPNPTASTGIACGCSEDFPTVTSPLTICQLVIDIAGDLSSKRGERLEDYTEAVRDLAKDDRFSDDLVRQLARVPGLRNVLVHEYVAWDMERVVEALRTLGPVEEFLRVVSAIAAETD